MAENKQRNNEFLSELPSPETLIRSFGVESDEDDARCIITKLDAQSCVEQRKLSQDPVQLDVFNEERYLYSTVRECANLALQYYITQTVGAINLYTSSSKLKRASWLMLGGALYYLTFKATGPHKEPTTFEAEVFHRVDETKVWRVRIKNPGTDWFDGKIYVPTPDKDNKLFFPGPIEANKLLFPRPEL